jgi:CHAD domain-containing protein
MTTELLLEKYDVDLEHARHVADLALALFDNTTSIHKLPKNTRRLLEIGALLHNVGMNVDQPQHHIVGRDIVLEEGFENLDADERAIVACLVSFHRKKVRPRLEPTYLSLGKKDQSVALRLSALLRVADGLDYSGSQTTQISDCVVEAPHIFLHLTGPHARTDGARALAKADLWRKAFATELAVELADQVDENDTEAIADEDTEADDADAAKLEASMPQLSPLRSNCALAEMGRVVLRQHFRRLLDQERRIRANKGPEAVHQMRVASRRLRATLIILNEVAPTGKVRTLRKEVQRTAQAASGVRDCDVFLGQVSNYVTNLLTDASSNGVTQPLVPLFDALQHDRAEAQTRLFAHLESDRYAKFKRDFAAFMTNEPEGWDTTLRVRDRAGSLIWQRYEDLRAHEIGLDIHNGVAEKNEALHELRLSGKRLRYMLEAFAEPLGPKADEVLTPLVALQDNLGAVQDVAVAVAYVANLGADDTDLEAYAASRIAERERLLAELPQRWEKVASATYRRKLMELIVKL